jgi:hypothetical protein
MGSTYPEPKQIACMKRGRCDFETGAKTERFTDYIPTRRQKVVQKAGRDSLGVPQEDPKESMRFGRVIVAGEHDEQGNKCKCTVAQLNHFGFYYP